MKIAIASGKGGTGKTFISTNLAAYWSEKKNVVLADLDVEEPNDALFFSMPVVKKEDKFKYIPTWDAALCTLCGQCQDVCNYHAIVQLNTEIMIFNELCHSCYACSELCPAKALPMAPYKIGELTQYREGALTLVESRLELGEEQAVPLIAQTHHFIDDNFSEADVQLFDSPPGTSCPMIEATKHADYVILVTEPTPFGEHDVKLAMQTIDQLKIPYGLVINRSDVGTNDLAAYCHANHIPVLASIPFNRRIAEAYAQGLLAYRQEPDLSEALKQVIDFFEKQ
ncbi:MAG: P-loop NTPase [Microbacter sp.]